MRGEKSKEKENFAWGAINAQYAKQYSVAIISSDPRSERMEKGGLMEWILRHKAVAVAVI